MIIKILLTALLISIPIAIIVELFDMSYNEDYSDFVLKMEKRIVTYACITVAFTSIVCVICLILYLLWR